MISDGTALIETPLAGMHQSAGAKMGVWFGCALPDDFGDSAAEEGYAVNSVALIDRCYRAYVSLTGPDRVRYLNAILTNNVRDLAEGHGTVSLLLNPQGRIQAEIETYALGERLFCVSYAMIRARLVEGLEKYIIMDDVTLTDETERYGTIGLEGPRTAEVVRELTGIEIGALAELEQVEARVGGTACRVSKRLQGGAVAADFLLERGDLASAWRALDAAARKHGGGPMGYAALSARRLAQGVPWFGYDFGEQQIPHEAGLEHSHISYTKGCYTGQEIVERVRSRGQVNRRRVRLQFEGDTAPAAGTALTAEGKEVGAVTRAGRSFFPPAVLGMGYLRKEYVEAGSAVEWAGGRARVL